MFFYSHHPFLSRFLFFTGWVSLRFSRGSLHVFTIARAKFSSHLSRFSQRAWACPGESLA
ncbi:hypothetical protein EBU02_07340 [bacterium]|nr:hypothetical protein [bacterium]